MARIITYVLCHILFGMTYMQVVISEVHILKQNVFMSEDSGFPIKWIRDQLNANVPFMQSGCLSQRWSHMSLDNELINMLNTK